MGYQNLYFNVMIIRINKYKAYISSLFLMVYFAFILIGLTHVHPDGQYDNKPVLVANNISHPGVSGQTEENCQICQLSSSLNINTSILFFSGTLTPECSILPNNETVHQYAAVNVHCLRGPPTV